MAASWKIPSGLAMKHPTISRRRRDRTRSVTPGRASGTGRLDFFLYFVHDILYFKSFIKINGVSYRIVKSTITSGWYSHNHYLPRLPNGEYNIS
jgi:hypothetical protein